MLCVSKGAHVVFYFMFNNTSSTWLIHLKVCTIVYVIAQQQTLKFVHYLTLVILGKVTGNAFI